VISYETAVALVLGENIGTTITARLASIGGSDNAKRASYSHIMVNILSVVIMVAIFPWYVEFIKALTGMDPLKNELVDGVPTFTQVTLGIATSHTVFNVCLAALYLPLVNPLVKLLYWIVPEREEGLPHLAYLDIRLIEAPAVAIEQSHRELVRMSGHTVAMMGSLRACWVDSGRNESRENEVFEKEKELDLMQKETIEFVSHLMQNSVPADLVEEGSGQLRIATELESIGDYIEKILKLKLKLVQAEQRFSDVGMIEIMDLHDHCSRYLLMVSQALAANNAQALQKAQVEGDDITHLIKEYRAHLLRRIENKEVRPFASLVFQDTLIAYRRIKDHALNVAEVLAGEK
jgi:phosphate:Na+ symporter